MSETGPARAKVSPAQAAEWLTRCDPQKVARTKRDAAIIKFYAGLMATGQWRSDVGGMLCFDSESGRLLDGHHRLLAMCEVAVSFHHVHWICAVTKFDDLHVIDRLELVSTIIGWFGTHRQPTISRLAEARLQTVRELWLDVCDETGIDAEPWPNYPAAPSREIFAHAPGADLPLTPDWESQAEIIERMRALLRKPTIQ